MKSQKISMSIEEYHLLPWKRGWKYEYFDDAAMISPRYWTETVQLKVQRQNTTAYSVQTPNESLRLAIAEGLHVAYFDSVEFCDYSEKHFAGAVETMTKNFFEYAQHNHAWIITLFGEPKRVLAGGYVKPVADGLMLESLFVRPEWQRAGLATVLLKHLCDQLVLEGLVSLESSYVIGNEASTAWHKKMGFEIIPDLTVARIDLHHALHEVERCQHLGLPMEALQEKYERLKKEVKRLEHIQDIEGIEAVMPLLKRRSKE